MDIASGRAYAGAVLKEIRIQNLGVIADATLELSPGLNVVTGETGAGKTMVVSGLGLLLGERADADRVRTGQKQAVVEGFLDVPADLTVLGDVDVEVEPGEDLILTRTVSANGRSRARIAGMSLPASVLADVGHRLVAVHGQADQWKLKRPEEHRAVLDAFAGPSFASQLRQYEAAFVQLKKLRAELRQLTEQAQERAQRLTMLEAGIGRVDEVQPVAGEDVELASEAERLTHAEDLLAATAGAARALAGDETSLEEPNALGLLASARQLIESAPVEDEQLAGFAARIKEVQTLAADVASDVAQYAAGIDMDPERLAQVHQRRAELTALMKAFGPELIDVLTWRANAGREAADLAGSDERIEKVTSEIEELTPAVIQLGAALHEARLEAAERLSKAVTAELKHLAMPSAQLSVSVQYATADRGLQLAEDLTVRPTESGFDTVEILLAANKGMAPKPVTKAASGGELSRVMLALEVVTNSGEVPTFVFDEVDAGVGGEAALDIGRRLAALAKSAQVLVVTHLAQVAAFADNHLVVRKSHDESITESGIVKVTGAERHAELARMLGGDASLDVALEHARALLDQASV